MLVSADIDEFSANFLYYFKEVARTSVQSETIKVMEECTPKTKLVGGGVYGYPGDFQPPVKTTGRRDGGCESAREVCEEEYGSEINHEIRSRNPATNEGEFLSGSEFVRAREHSPSAERLSCADRHDSR